MSITIALAGNPNSGKTTLFNDLTGANQYVGNWPGVTVEKKEGRLKGNKEVRIVDLPGIYSLSPYTPEEVVSRDYLLSGEPQVILNLVDSTNLERNLYLTTQLLEIGLPVVLALNMADLIRKDGTEIDAVKLGKELGCQVVSISALKSEGTKEAVQTAVELASAGSKGAPQHAFSADVEKALVEIAGLIENKTKPETRRWYAVKLFERDSIAQKEMALSGDVASRVDALIAGCESSFDDDSESIITGERYGFISQLMAQAVKRQTKGLTTSDKIDRIVTNRWLALPIFAAIMFLVYFISMKSVGDFVTGWTNDVLFGEWIGGGAEALLSGMGAADWVISLVVDGIVGGVGAVLGFVPQLIILFILLSFLEDCGYMARVAFIMDRIFRKFGLSGKSFIPMLISSGCGVPGIMATKTIENEKDRRMTVMTTTFIPCSAKLPIIAMITTTIMGEAWWVAPIIYFAGVGSVIVSGIILKKTKPFAGDPAPFVMELPQYHMPSVKGLVMHVWERVRSFIVKAGTVIFVSSIVIWCLTSLGFENGFGFVTDSDYSLMAIVGGFFAPIFAPLGFGNWQAVAGTISGLVAKENLVSTLAIIAKLGEEAVEGILDNPEPLGPLMVTMLGTRAAAMSFLLFNMLCAPCFAAIGAIRKQMASFKWTMFAVLYQCIFAYIVALIVYQLALWFATGVFGIGAVVALVLLGAMLFLLFRPDPNKKVKKQMVAA